MEGNHLQMVDFPSPLFDYQRVHSRVLRWIINTLHATTNLNADVAYCVQKPSEDGFSAMRHPHHSAMLPHPTKRK